MKEQTDWRSAVPLWAALAIPVLWGAAILAYAYTDGMNLITLLARFLEAVQYPLAIGWTANTPKFLAGGMVLYGCGIGMYYATRRTTRFGEEHGSARWGSARQLNSKYMDQKKRKTTSFSPKMSAWVWTAKSTAATSWKSWWAARAQARLAF